MNFFCFSFALNQKYRAANLLRLIVAKSNAVEGNHSGESDIRRIYVTFLEKHFSTKLY